MYPQHMGSKRIEKMYMQKEKKLKEKHVFKDKIHVLIFSLPSLSVTMVTCAAHCCCEFENVTDFSYLTCLSHSGGQSPQSLMNYY